MHRRLRSLVSLHLGPGREADGALKHLLRALDRDYKRADEDRLTLDRALALIGDVARRAPPEVPAAKPHGTSLSRLARRLFEDVPVASFLYGPGLEVIAWNAAAEKLFGIRSAEAVGRAVPALLFAEAERAGVGADLRRVLERGEIDQSLRVSAVRHADARLDEWTAVPLRDRHGAVVAAAVLVQEPFSTGERQVAALEGTGDALFSWDVPGDHLWLSDSWAAMLGGVPRTGSSEDWLGRVHPSDKEALDQALQEHLEGRSPRFESEHRLRDAAGAFRWFLARGKAIRAPAGGAVRLAGAMMDVTERREAAERALHDALHDPLTRLPNRSLFLDLVKRAFARTRRREAYAFAVVFLDLDRFKGVNDGLGHAAGDELLVEMAKRLQGCLREGDTLARHGGDEFTILLDDVKSPSDAQIVADRIHHATGQPFHVAGQEVFSTVSVGVAISNPSYARPSDLLHDADTAMYRAKALGRARTVVFDGHMRDRAPHLMELETDLRRALVKDEFRVHFQPVVEVASGRIQGLEALIRWAHPKRGLILPEAFIPFAEETGLSVPMGSWLLKQAGREFEECRRVAAGIPLALHVNLSQKQLLSPDLLAQIDEILAHRHLEPADLAVELSEHTLQQRQTATRLGELRQRGVRVCMDDFGTGAASLQSLHGLTLDALKIDRSLFHGGSPRGRSPELVRSIVTIARELGTRVVAEGVETADQLGFLRELGCQAAQGFFFSPPVEGGAARTLLASGASW